jgi:hypothetical protein
MKFFCDLWSEKCGLFGWTFGNFSSPVCEKVIYNSPIIINYGNGKWKFVSNTKYENYEKPRKGLDRHNDEISTVNRGVFVKFLNFLLFLN